MASFTFKPHRQRAPLQFQFTSFSHCKYSCSTLNIFKFHSQSLISFSRKHNPHLLVKAHVANTSSKAGAAVRNSNSGPNDDFKNESFSFPSANGNTGRKVILRDRNAKRGLNPETRKGEDKDRRNLVGKNSDKKIKSWKEGTGDKAGSDEVVVEKKGKMSKKVTHHLPNGSNEVVVEKKGKGSKKAKVHLPDGSNEVVVDKKGKPSKKAKVHLPELTLRVGLDMCSKRGDVVGAIDLYELARKEGIRMGQYHFGVLLYLCSSAASGVVQPAKSGSRSRSLNPGDPLKDSYVVGTDSTSGFSEMEEMRNDFGAEDVASGGPNSSSDGEEDLSMEVPPQSLDGLVQELKKRNSERLKNREGGNGVNEIQISEDVKRLALEKGFEIYSRMRAEKIPMNEATLTSVARMAIAFEDGDMAFDMVKQMKEYGINPRLRSYGPALAIFSGKGDVEKAFMVENHMLANGVYPEEPELATLLKLSIGTGKSDRVYYIMHKLRTSVRQVSPATADLIQSWFESKTAARVGKRKWNKQFIAEAIASGGGGWHGKGWLGSGKWKVCRSPIGSDGVCTSCGEKLVTIDLDPEETERFAQSVASLAAQREKNSSFQKFQEWLDSYGPFEAVVDGANVGLLSQRSFKPTKVNVIADGMRQMSPSRKWPLIVLHNRRITGGKMNETFNRALIEKWKNAKALYATPTGSNDDWYWLYAAIKCKCLLVTNDEMRDHVFQLLGNDFFPKWKERHQVRFSFSERGPEIHMPPPYSVVIQESEKGHWHVPITSEVEQEDRRTWLCFTRANSSLADQDSASQKEVLPHSQQKGGARKGAKKENYIKEKLETPERPNPSRQKFQELDLIIKRDTASSMSENHHSILPRIKAAEKLSSYLIDFQI